MHGAQGTCRLCGRTARFGAYWRTPCPAGTLCTHHPALAIGRTPRALAAGSHPPCLPRRRMAAPHGPSGRPEYSGLRPSLRRTSTDNQLVSTIVHSVRPRTTIIYPGRSAPPYAAPRCPRQRKTAQGSHDTNAIAPARSLLWALTTHCGRHHERQPCTHRHCRPRTDIGAIPIASDPNTSGSDSSGSGTHAGPHSSVPRRSRCPRCPRHPGLPNPRTRKGPPPCGSGPCCIMHRAGVSPARSRAGARPARQDR